MAQATDDTIKVWRRPGDSRLVQDLNLASKPIETPSSFLNAYARVEVLHGMHICNVSSTSIRGEIMVHVEK